MCWGMVIMLQAVVANLLYTDAVRNKVDIRHLKLRDPPFIHVC